jgi:hypothetical protein
VVESPHQTSSIVLCGKNFLDRERPFALRRAISTVAFSCGWRNLATRCLTGSVCRSCKDGRYDTKEKGPVQGLFLHDFSAERKIDFFTSFSPRLSLPVLSFLPWKPAVSLRIASPQVSPRLSLPVLSLLL